MGLRLGARHATRAAEGERDAEELAIVRRAVTDHRAFAPLYERYVDPIYAHCHRLLGSREAAEDACAVTFRAWLFAIADNVLRDLARTSHPTAPLPYGDAWRGSDPGPEASALLADERERLRAALAELPGEWRRVVLLRLGGLSCAEVAQALGPHRNEVWVRQAHRRAILRLREVMIAADSAKGDPR